MDKEDAVYMCVCVHTHTHTHTQTHTHNGILLSHKKNDVSLFATVWLDLDMAGGYYA